MAWRQKLMGKGEGIPKELLIDKEEDPQVAIESKEITEEDIYNQIKEDMDRLPEAQKKELHHHVEGIIHSNALAYKHEAEGANHLVEASRLLTMPGMVVLAHTTARPLVGVYLPLKDTFTEEAKWKREETLQVKRPEYKSIDEICIDQNLPHNAREWEYQHEGDANRRLAAVVTRYIHEALMRDKKQFYSSVAIQAMFDVPASTINKLISGKKYMGGAELERYRAEMKRKDVDIPKRCEMKQGGWKSLETLKPSTSTSNHD